MSLVATGMRATYGDWPKGKCVESSIALVAALRPDVQAVPVWGEVLIGWDCEPHAWVELDDGTILDMTAGQWLGGSPWRVVHVADPEWHDYRAQLRGADVIQATLLRMVGVIADMAAER